MTSRFVRSSELVSREVAGETVVVPICRGVGDLDSIYTFNGVGTHLWSLLAEARTEADLGTFLTERFAVSGVQAKSDVRNFLVELQDAGLVRTL
ncbi:MAG: PqqD family protein [Candidatus Acidiferrum sp.]